MKCMSAALEANSNTYRRSDCTVQWVFDAQFTVLEVKPLPKTPILLRGYGQDLELWQNGSNIGVNRERNAYTTVQSNLLCNELAVRSGPGVPPECLATVYVSRDTHAEHIVCVKLRGRPRHWQHFFVAPNSHCINQSSS